MILAASMGTPQPPAGQVPASSSVSAAVKPEMPAAEATEELPGPSVANSRLPEPSAAAPYTITIPSCSGWFSWEQIHETERRILPEFFDGKSMFRNPRVYKYCRDSIVRRFRENPSRKITFTDARRGLIGDVGSIRRVFDFLEEWGLINYTPSPSAKPSSSSISTSKDKREAATESSEKDSARRICFNCKAPCSLSCFTTEKADIILCARCFVRGNYRPGLSSTDFKRVDISEETKAEWSDKETLHLLEAILQYGEDWKKVAEHVGSRNEKECVARFIKLPFGEQFMGLTGSSEYGRENQKDDDKLNTGGGDSGIEQCFSKRQRLTPFADASNPIMAQVAFLSAMAGSDVAQAAAHAAIAALHKVNTASDSPVASTTNVYPIFEVLNEAAQEAFAQLEKEERDMEQYLSDVLEVQMKEIQDRIIHYEEVELLVEKEKLQVQYMRDLLFADQLALIQHKARVSVKANEGRSCSEQLNM